MRDSGSSSGHSPTPAPSHIPAAVNNAVNNNNNDQQASAAAAVQAPPDDLALSRGTTLIAEFSHSLNAKKLKAGDKVKAILTQDLIAKGKIIAPNETRLVGHVTEVKRSTDTDPESRLGIVFDKLLFVKHHHEVDFQAGVQALLAPVVRRSRVDEPDHMHAACRCWRREQQQ